MRVIALTGGIGCGKSLAAQYFAELGALVIDADQLARAAIERGSLGFDEVVTLFGDSILKDGKYEGKYLVKELSQYDLLRKMVGEANLNLEYKIQRERQDLKDQECVLDIRNITRVPYVRNVSFRMYKGEVLGLAGLLGSGRTETVRIIFGCDIPDSGEILLGGKKVNFVSPKDAVGEGIAFCTENRREEGLCSFHGYKK